MEFLPRLHDQHLLLLALPRLLLMAQLRPMFPAKAVLDLKVKVRADPTKPVKATCHPVLALRSFQAVVLKAR